MTPGGNEESDLNSLTRMIIAETGFARDEDEMAQIVFVALNRADLYGKSPAEIVDPAGRAPAWNASAKYEALFEDALSSPRWDAAQSFVAQLLGGGGSNRGYTKFVHPGAMPEPPCTSGRVEAETTYGTRCLPEWIVEGNEVGGALFA